MPQSSRPLLGRLGLAVLASLALTLSLAAPVSAATKTPATPSVLPKGIEALAAYVPSNSCNPTAKPGTVKLAKLLTKTYPRTSYGISRTCPPTANSEHLEGRAVDWMNSVRNPTQAAQAKAVIGWLLAKDKSGQPAANARRLGVMYVIWNNQIWGAYNADQGWRPYSNCATNTKTSADSACHRNHMHISLSWEGAMGRTSFWSKSVARADYGPCRARDLNWAATYSKANPVPCPRYAKVTAVKGASATKKTLVTYSGMDLRLGSQGTAVKAVQRTVRTTADGDFGPQTKVAVRKWQRAHKITDGGVVNAATWRAMLKAVK
jgi:hypothetical protein